ncbi:hypothetical protein GL263_06070 [Streptomyces durbertensis]|uniref:Uncharacterized protein n=1 Tax=Streptomyces durbertensis TaxID=2448886 RepID=A0ABR6EF88_9ACTN|nr:hypothetical protein [Streptomyces durbertensis]MBB1243134.1 hypothetical protein [Streptomyces durbertensis]
MTQPTEPADENEILYRYEITTAMNSVIRACQEIVHRHSSLNNWAPAGTSDPMAPTHRELIEKARKDVLNRLHLVVQAAETVAYEIERHRQRVAHNRNRARNSDSDQGE